MEQQFEFSYNRHIHLPCSHCITLQNLHEGSVDGDVSYVDEFCEPLTRRDSAGISITIPAHVLHTWFWKTMKGCLCRLALRQDNIGNLKNTKWIERGDIYLNNLWKWSLVEGYTISGRGRGAYCLCRRLLSLIVICLFSAQYPSQPYIPTQEVQDDQVSRAHWEFSLHMLGTE